MEQKREKEQRELERLNKMAAFHVGASYLLYAMVVLTVIYVVDEVTSNINAAMQPYVLFDLFHITSRDVNSTEYTNAINVVAPMQVASQFLLIVTPFYKALSDRFGRRIFLMINTVGMGLGMLVVMTAQNVAMYIVGMLCMLFFTPNDMQVLYIMETAPKEKRATLSFVAKGIALISVSVIGVLSRVFLNDTDPSSWRRDYMIPVVVAILVGVISYFLLKETPVFVEQRRSYLSMTPEEREQKKKENEKDKTTDEGGVFTALRYVFANKQLFWILIAGFIFFATTFYTSYYATVLEGAMTTAMVSSVLVIYPFFNGVMTILSGFLSDRLGRKKVCLLLGSIALAGLLLFVLACNFGWGAFFAGMAYGCSIGGLWSMSDTLILTMPAESSPSGMRSSVMGVMSILIGAGSFLGQVIFIICQNFLPMGTLFLIICVPFMILSLVILMTKVKETRDVDLDKVTADTFK